MPKRGRSGIRNLYKEHNSDCRNREPLKCDCPWYGKYKHVNRQTWLAGRASTSTRDSGSTPSWC